MMEKGQSETASEAQRSPIGPAAGEQAGPRGRGERCATPVMSGCLGGVHEHGPPFWSRCGACTFRGFPRRGWAHKSTSSGSARARRGPALC
eukprot:gene21269-biopygen4138